jgi:hypothetical protein
VRIYTAPRPVQGKAIWNRRRKIAAGEADRRSVLRFTPLISFILPKIFRDRWLPDLFCGAIADVTMVQLLGILIVVNTLVSALWWSVTNKQWNVSLIAIAVVALALGVAFIFHQRLLELVRADIASIAADRRNAEANARTIAAIREQVEANVARINRIANDSADAKRAASEMQKSAPQTATPREPAEAQLFFVGGMTSEFTESRPLFAALKSADEKGFNWSEPTRNDAQPGEKSEREMAPEASTKTADTPAAEREAGTEVSGNKLETTLLKQRFDEAVGLYKAKQLPLAYVAAKSCVELYESESKQDGASSSGEVTPDGAAAIYSVGGEIAQRMGEHVRALEWAKKAVELKPSPDRKALLVTTYLNLHQRGDADKIIHEAMTGHDGDSVELKKLLTQFGVIKTPAHSDRARIPRR